MKRMSVVVVAAMILLASSMVGLAAEPQGWKGEITPYLWYAGLEGDVTINGQKTDFEKSASDLFEYVEAGGSLLGVVQYNRFVAWGEVDYFSMSTDALDAEEQPLGGKFDSTMTIGQLAAGYQFSGWKEGQTIDLLIGVRMTSMDNDLTIFGDPATTISKDHDLTDPILVVRPSIPLFPSKTKKWRLNATLGFGAGGDSDQIYELFPQVQWQITDHMAARFGYRSIGYKFKGEKNDNELNTKLSGLVLGLGATF